MRSGDQETTGSKELCEKGSHGGDYTLRRQNALLLDGNFFLRIAGCEVRIAGTLESFIMAASGKSAILEFCIRRENVSRIRDAEDAPEIVSRKTALKSK